MGSSVVGADLDLGHVPLVSCDGGDALVSRDGRWNGGAEEVVVFAGSVWESSYTGHSAHPPPAN